MAERTWPKLVWSCALEKIFMAIDKHPYNATQPSLSGIAAYRSSLTLDWLRAEDTRQRELASAFEEAAPVKAISTDCIANPRPAPGKIGRLMLEVLKNLEGDEGNLVSELIQVLVRTKILVETSILETEPDLDSLVKTPGMMLSEPHATFPRIVAVVWMVVTDPATNRKHGWCSINKMNQYLRLSKPQEIAQQMRTLELVVARARFIMEEFIHNIMPVDMYRKKSPRKNVKLPHPEETAASKVHTIKQRANENLVHSPYQFGYTHPTNLSQESEPDFEVVDGSHVFVTNGWVATSNWKLFLPLVFLISLILLCEYNFEAF